MKMTPIKVLKNLTIIKGAGRGEKIGVPTINFAIGKIDLEEGIYLCKVKRSDPYWGLLHYGPRPTFGELNLSLEVYLLDFEKRDRIETPIDVEVYDFIRPILKFDSPEVMVEKIKDDIDKARFLISS